MKSYHSFLLAVGCFLLQLCGNDVLSSDLFQDPPASPSLYTFENWRELTHTDQATYSDSTVPLPPVSNSWQDSGAEIFVGVVSYRDARCATTLMNLFDKAEFPDRVRVGVVEQVQTEEDQFSCLRDYCKLKGGALDRNCPRQSQVRIIQLTHNVGRGPNFARYMQDSLVQNEEFCMQVDAHSDFARHWDTLQLKMWGSVQNEFAVLSSTPVDVAVLKRPDLNTAEQLVPHLCQAKVDDRGMIVSLPPTLAAHLPRPILTPLYAAGNVFSRCHAVKRVPADPTLQMVFEADEFATFARLWTRGYDVYTPNKIAVAHDYLDKMQGANLNPRDKAMEWATRRPGQAQFNRYLYEHSMDRIATLLGLPGAKRDLQSLATLTRYGLGGTRTLEQLIAFTGIDLHKREVAADRCEELKWVPYSVAPSADPFTDNTDVWGGAPEVYVAGQGVPSLSGDSVTIYPHEAYINAYKDAVNSDSFVVEDGGVRSVYSAPRSVLENLNSLNKIVKEDLRHDAQYLRDKVHGYVGDAEVVLKQDMKQIGALVRHRGSELWWLFQPLDTALEEVMNRLDEEFGVGMGSKVMKLFLLLIPLLIMIVIAAHRILVGPAPISSDGHSSSSAGAGLPALFGSPVKCQLSSGKQH